MARVVEDPYFQHYLAWMVNETDGLKVLALLYVSFLCMCNYY